MELVIDGEHPKTNLVIVDDLLQKSSKVIPHVCLFVIVYLKTLDSWTILYIAFGHFHFNTMEYIFSCKIFLDGGHVDGNGNGFSLYGVIAFCLFEE